MVVASRVEQAAAEVAAQLGHPAVAVALDVTDAASVRIACRMVGARRLLVNNAAVLLDAGAPVTATDPQVL